MATDSNYYSPSQQYAGKTLSQLGGSMGFRADLLANFLGISPNAPLSTDASYQIGSLPENYRGDSGEGNAFRSIFSAAGMSPEQKAVQPAIKSLESSIPEIQQKFGVERSRLEGEKEPLKQRYQLLLDQLKNRENKTTQQESIRLAREYGKRGVPVQSGMFEKNLSDVINPITSEYGNLMSQTALSREDSLRQIMNLVNQLTPQETEATRTVRNAIANLQAGAGKDAISNAFEMLKFQEQQRQSNTQYELARQALEYQKTKGNIDTTLDNIWKKYSGL